MRVQVDKARRHVHRSGVDHARGPGFIEIADPRDLAAADADISPEARHPGAVYYRSATNNRVELRHVRIPCKRNRSIVSRHSQKFQRKGPALAPRVFRASEKALQRWRKAPLSW